MWLFALLVVISISPLCNAYSLSKLHRSSRLRIQRDRARYDPLYMSFYIGSNATKSNDNVGLFAAGDIKTVSAPSTFSSTIQLQPSFNRSSSIEAQVELLRLEAEREKLIMDKDRIDAEKKKLIEIDKFILMALNEENQLDDLVLQNKQLICKELFFRIIELSNTVDKTNAMRARFTTLCDNFMISLLKTYPSIHAQLLAEIQQELNQELNRFQINQQNRGNENIKAYDQVLTKWMEAQKASNDSSTLVSSIGPDGTFMNQAFNLTDILSSAGNRTMLRFPSAIPINLLPLILRGSEISKEDIELVKSTIFTNDLVNNAQVDTSTYIVTLRGKAKDNMSLTDTVNEINRRIELVPDLKDRIKLFLLPEYRIQDEKNMILEKYNSGSKYEPVFTILSSSVKPAKSDVAANIFSVATFLISIVSSFVYATDVNSLNKNFMELALAGDATAVERVLPICLGIIGIQLFHEIGHRLMAAVHNVKLSLPYFIPSLDNGLFGSVVNFLSFPKTRGQMFDIALAGPFFGFLLSIVVAYYGVTLTVGADSDIVSTFPSLPVQYFQNSWLFSKLVEQIPAITTTVSTMSPPIADQAISQLPSTITASIIPLHPFVIIGMTGLLANALNCLPIGRLDGGRIVMAIGGRETANTIAFAASLVQVLSALFSSSSEAFIFWALFVLFIQRGADLPPENDITPINTDNFIANILRSSSLAFVSVFTLLTLLPAPVETVETVSKLF